MSVRVGKIKELARHFRGEGGASFPPPSAIYLPGQEPPTAPALERDLFTMQTATTERAIVAVAPMPFQPGVRTQALRCHAGVYPATR
jgi:hypothetical protein